MSDHAPASHAEATGALLADPAVNLASNRTSLSFERTRMSADRTLMAIIRTSLSMISFGFTIFQFFHQLSEKYGVGVVSAASARNFGLSLGLLGVGLLIAGLGNHTQLILSVRARRNRLHGEGLLRSGPQYRTSPTAVIAVLLLLLGLACVIGMIVRAGPFR
jgi:putative membrane protein